MSEKEIREKILKLQEKRTETFKSIQDLENTLDLINDEIDTLWDQLPDNN